MESNRYTPPVRKSLTDEELSARVEYATSTKMGIEAMMDLVVAQEALRAQEDLEIEKWLEEMEAEGSPESLRVAENYRRAQSGLSELPQVEQVFPVEEPAVVEVVEEVIAAPSSFSWFTQPEPEIEEAEALEEVVEEEVVEEEILVETTPDEQEVESAFIHPVTTEPVGTETEDEFEHLLASAAAEEELTALEENEITRTEKSDESSVNTLIPSDEHRNRKPISQLLVWLGVSATVLPISLTWLLITFGLSANAILVDLVVGYLIAGVIISTASLAGKRSGLATAIVSRAIFGVWGNAIPGSVVFVSRIAVAAFLLAITVNISSAFELGLPDFSASVTSVGSLDLNVGMVGSAIAVLLIAALTLVRGSASRVLQLVLSSAAFAAVVVALTGISSATLGFATPGTSELFSKASLLGVATIVLAVTTLWVAIAPNLAKSIPMAERGLKVFGFVAIANFVLPALVGVVALTWFGPRVSQLVNIMPLDLGILNEIISELPQYAQAALVTSFAITLVYALFLTLKTAVLDLTSVLQTKSRVLGLLLTVLLVIGTLVLFALQPAKVSFDYLVNVFILVAALTAGWIGMLVTDVALRRIAYHELSLSRSYGFYKRFSILSIVSWVLSVAVALALIPINLRGLSFTGFGLQYVSLENNITSAPLGFLIALVSGALLTLAVRIPEIRKQEREVLAVESRREQLNNIFLGQE
jgi:purine-cytosine permease-like protein